MGRPRDEEAWEQVTKHENGTWTCKRCGRSFSGGAARIRAHLGKEKRKGIALCEGSSVPGNQGGNSTAAMAMAMDGSSDPMEVVDGMHSFQVASQAPHTFDDSIPSSSNYQNVIPADTLLCEGEARQAHHTIFDSIPYSSYNHQNVPPPNHLFEVPRYADHTIGGKITNSSNHQNVPPPNNLFEAGGAAHELDTGLPIHTSQGLPNVDNAVGNDHGGFEDEIRKVKELVDMLTREEGNIDRELQWLLESHTGQKRRREAEDEAEDEVNEWLKEVKKLKERANKMIELLSGQGWSTDRSALEEKINKLREDVHTHVEGKPFVLSSNEYMLGLYFDKKLKELFALARDKKVLIIGVHGMGGVGKTALVTHFKYKALRRGDFKEVILVTVSQDFSILKLQSAIAKRIGIKLDKDDEIVERANRLSMALDKKGALLLILDDVWNYIDLRKVGIPLRAVDGIKIILTCRLNHVFRQMDCPPRNIIQMEPLYRDGYDDWKLFLLKLGCYGTPATLTPEIENIASSIVERCDGLPLGISVMARTMKGVNDIRQWRHALYKLENSAMGGEMEDEVFKSLKLSYDHLMDKNIQNCFLVCALHGKCSKEQLIMKFVEEGLIKETKSLEEIFDEGHAILDQLEGHSLLLGDKLMNVNDDYEDEDEYEYEYKYDLSMNGLVRDMARYVVKIRYMVKGNQSLRQVPDMQEWAADLEKVSLRSNHIKEIPESMSPSCPRLSTLILSNNKLSQIPNGFFSDMGSLTRLDLSYNRELSSLPYSLSRLRSLKSLLLKGCCSLKYVPSLCELRELTRLVISGTSIERVPEGLATLVKLRWLDLSYNRELTSVPWSVLLGLTNMKYLDLRSKQVTVKIENVKEIMSVLEYFACYFHLTKDFADYMEYILDRGIGPKHCHLLFGIANTGIYRKYDLTRGYTKDHHYLRFRDGEAVNHLPTDLLELELSSNEQWSGGICDALSFKVPSSLREISVAHCPKLEWLFCLNGSCYVCKHLHNLHSLILYNLERLEFIWKEIEEGMSLRNLSSLTIWRCNKLEKLLTPEALLQLPNLETIEVQFCDSMKEIFARRGYGEGDDDIDSTITLPNSFKTLLLWYLPQLKNVCANIIVSRSPPTLDVMSCPNLIRSSVRHKSSHSDLNTVILW